MIGCDELAFIDGEHDYGGEGFGIFNDFWPEVSAL